MESDRPQKVKVKQVPPGPPKSGVMAFWERHGNRILLAVTVLALLYALVQYRRAATRRADESAWDNLNTARQRVQEFHSMDILRLPPDQIVQDAATIEGNVGPALDSIINDADQSKLVGPALVTRGDLYWTLANLPEAPGATTRPSLRLPASDAEYLKRSEDAYTKALSLPYDPFVTTNARFGLAAVAENRGQWDEAAKYYDAITGDAKAIESSKTLAGFRRAQLADLRLPLFTTPATAPSTAPSTQSAGELPVTPVGPVMTPPPTTKPAETAPATLPADAAPTTSPATVPAAS
jgi:hypothetical protein